MAHITAADLTPAQQKGLRRYASFGDGTNAPADLAHYRSKHKLAQLGLITRVGRHLVNVTEDGQRVADEIPPKGLT